MKKYFILMSLIGLFTTTLQAQELPSSWINPNTSLEKSANDMVEEASDASSEHFLKVMSFNQELTEKALGKNNKKGQWYLQSIMTELAIEPVGTIGPMGIKGETAVELIWTRTAASKAQLTNNKSIENSPESDEMNDSIVLDQDMKQEDIEDSINAIATSLERSGKISNKDLFFKSAMPHVLKFKNAAIAMNNSRADQKWFAYKFQIELYAEATGSVTPFMSVGGGTRVRLEWYRYQSANKNLNLSAIDMSNSETLDNIASDFEELAELTSPNAPYKLNNFKVGIGVGIKGKIFVAKGKAGVIGSVFYKRNPKAVNKNLPESNLNPVIPMAELDQEAGVWKHTPIERSILKGQMKKVIKMANFFSGNALKHAKAQKNKHFELNFIELELELFLRGTVGLATIEGISVVELFLSKQK